MIWYDLNKLRFFSCLLVVLSTFSGSYAITSQERASLSTLLTSDSADDRASAARKLAEAGETTPLIAALQNKDPQMRLFVIPYLGYHLSTETLSALLATMQKDTDAQVRATALQQLGNLVFIPEMYSTYPIVSETVARMALKDPSLNNRMLALLNLDSDAASLLKVCLKSLESDDLPLRKLAIQRLPRSVDPTILTNFLHDPRNQDIRSMLLYKLGEMKATTAYHEIQPLCADPQEIVAQNACLALGKLGNAEAAEILINILFDEQRSITVRESAATALAQLAVPEKLPQLLDAVVSPKTQTRKVACIALAGYLDPQAGEALAAALKDNEQSVRQAAISGIITCHNTSTIMPLLRMVQAQPELRNDIIPIVSYLSDAQALDFLIKIAQDSKTDPNLRKNALLVPS